MGRLSGRVLAALAFAVLMGPATALGEDLTHCNAGVALREKKQFTQARVELKSCLARGALTANSQMIAHMNLSTIAFGLKNWQEVVNEYDAAAKAAQAAGHPMKTDASLLYTRGVALLELKRPKEARAALDGAVALAPKQWEVLTARMDALVLLGQTDLALADGQALANSPDRKVAIVGHMRRAALFQEQKKNDDALKEINAASAFDTGNLEIVMARMNLYAATNQPDKALADGARLAASTDKRFAVTGHIARAQIMRSQQRKDETINELNAALKIAPDDMAIVAERMTAQESWGQTDKALADSQILVASKNPQAQMIGHSFRGVVFDQQKKYPEALAEADAMIKLEPKNSTGFNNRCMAQANLGRANDAIATCQQALALTPQSPPVWNSMGYALEKAGRYGEAVTYFQKVATAVPGDKGNLADLARAQKEAAGAPAASSPPPVSAAPVSSALSAAAPTASSAPPAVSSAAPAVRKVTHRKKRRH